jgi:hypothetical protein
MTAQSGDQTTGGLAPSASTERITVALIPKAAADLQRLQERTSLSKTDIINRAITLYEFMSAQLQAGNEILILDKQTGEAQIVLLLLFSGPSPTAPQDLL